MLVIPKNKNQLAMQTNRFKLQSKLKENYNYEKDSFFVHHSWALCKAPQIKGIDYMCSNHKKLDLW